MTGTDIDRMKAALSWLHQYTGFSQFLETPSLLENSIRVVAEKACLTLVGDQADVFDERLKNILRNATVEDLMVMLIVARYKLMFQTPEVAS